MAMQELRLGAIENLKRGLTRGLFTSHSYESTFNNEDGTLVGLTFMDRSEFNFALIQPKTEINPSSYWKTVESPGRYFISTETYEYREFDQAFQAIYSWAERVGEEVVLGARAYKDTSDIEEWRRKLEQSADGLEEPDKPFTLEEIEGWWSQLGKLIERLAEADSESRVQRVRLEHLKKELRRLKENGETVPKRTWLKSVGNKVLDFLDTASKDTITSVTEVAVKALLEHKP
jgi:hypothetical protein